MTNLNKAFRQLRKNGYFARQNFLCCDSCAWSSMTTEESQKAVFYHSQGAADLRKTGKVYLSWSGDAVEIINTFERYGIETQWDGIQEKKIQISIK
jgi:hypothetical protein